MAAVIPIDQDVVGGGLDIVRNRSVVPSKGKAAKVVRENGRRDFGWFRKKKTPSTEECIYRLASRGKMQSKTIYFALSMCI
jgi:hypothetical protein